MSNCLLILQGKRKGKGSNPEPRRAILQILTWGMKNGIVVVSDRVEKKIYLVRGKKVMLDSDLADLYGIETRYLKRQVRRNRDRFPEDFMFQLTQKESDSLRCQNVTLKRGSHSKYAAYVFTEQGIAMLSSVLGSRRAVHVNIQIMRTFVRIRDWMSSHQGLAFIFDAIRRLMSPDRRKKRRIGFEQK